ncbi:MAG TPA: TonB-dependent receptor [Candidatus Angelobacter sp.]|nr:TonB-dependent receptor [Candidatus Angelobacter sp.]
MRLFNSLWRLAIVSMLAAGLAYAQGVGASGDMKGIVSDPTGAVIPGVIVTVTNSEKGIQRTAQSDHTGQYVVPGLPPATYQVTAEAPGFQKEILRMAAVTVGQVLVLDFHLKVSTSSEQVEVTSLAPVVEVDRGHQADTVTEQYIENLPIDRRDYLTYTQLMGGTSDSQTVVGADYRVRQTPQTGLSFYGSNGRGNNVTVDGGQFNGDSGAVEVNLSQDAVQEFQINRSNYSADLGAASGASINIVSKSGTNELHGTVYGFFRNDAMDARNPFAFTSALQPGQLSAATGFSTTATGQPAKDTLSRQQFGATVGFPIAKDKTFVFLSYEGLRQKAQTTVPLLLNSNIFAPQSGPANDQQQILAALAAGGGTPVPCLTGQPALPSAVCAGILQNVLTINPAASPLNQFLVNKFETNGGLFPNSTITNYWSGRLDHTFNGHDQASLRYLYSHSNQGDPDIGSLVGVSRGSTVKNWTSSLQGSWYHQISARTQNEFRAQWNLTAFDVFSNDPGGPGFDIAGFAALGRDITLPNFSTLRQYEFADNLTLIRGHHTMKTGFSEVIRGNRTSSATFLGGDFSFGSLPGGILSPCLQVPAACGLTGVAPAFINSMQAFSLGLPSFYQQGFGNPTTVANLPLTALYWQDAWAITPNFTLNYGLRYELDTRWVMPTDHKNFAPRVSFAWDPLNDHKTVIRGGAGIFYSPTYVQIDFATQELGNINGSRQISNFLIPITNPGPVNAASIFQTLFAQGKLGGCGLAGGPGGAGSGACVTAADLAQFGINASNSGPLPPFADVYHVPSTFHNPYAEQASFGIEREVSKDMSVSANYIYVHTLRLPQTRDTNLLPTAPLTTAINGNQFQNWGAPQCGIPGVCFVNPLVLQNNEYESNTAALYQGGIFEFKKRFSEHYTVVANYTYSKAYDDTTDFSYFPSNQANLAGERGLSSFDQRHKVTVYGVLESPWKNIALNGFQFSPIVRYNSGHPFNLLVGTDQNGDRHGTNDRPAGAGRNTGLGPNYTDLDLRLSRQFKITERTHIQFVAEAFNLLNHTNFSGVNNIVGANYGGIFGQSFHAQADPTASPSQPLGYTSAFAKREIQLGARFSF